jgi:hypothetical protein
MGVGVRTLPLICLIIYLCLGSCDLHLVLYDGQRLWVQDIPKIRGQDGGATWGFTLYISACAKTQEAQIPMESCSTAMTRTNSQLGLANISSDVVYFQTEKACLEAFAFHNAQIACQINKQELTG